MSAYMAGERTAPAQPLTLDWGHGIFLRAWAKCVRRLRKLKKLGGGSILAGFARSPTIVSQVMVVSIVEARIVKRLERKGKPLRRGVVLS